MLSFDLLGDNVKIYQFTPNAINAHQMSAPSPPPPLKFIIFLNFTFVDFRFGCIKLPPPPPPPNNSGGLVFGHYTGRLPSRFTIRNGYISLQPSGYLPTPHFLWT